MGRPSPALRTPSPGRVARPARAWAGPPTTPVPGVPPGRPIGTGSSGIPGCYEEFDQRAQQGLAPPPDVVHELEEPQVQRQPLLRDPPVRPQPAPEQRPEPLQRVDVHLAETIAVVVA